MLDVWTQLDDVVETQVESDQVRQFEHLFNKRLGKFRLQKLKVVADTYLWQNSIEIHLVETECIAPLRNDQTRLDLVMLRVRFVYCKILISLEVRLNVHSVLHC